MFFARLATFEAAFDVLRTHGLFCEWQLTCAWQPGDMFIMALMVVVNGNLFYGASGGNW